MRTFCIRSVNPRNKLRTRFAPLPLTAERAFAVRIGQARREEPNRPARIGKDARPIPRHPLLHKVLHAAQRHNTSESHVGKTNKLSTELNPTPTTPSLVNPNDAFSL